METMRCKKQWPGWKGSRGDRNSVSEVLGWEYKCTFYLYFGEKSTSRKSDALNFASCHLSGPDTRTETVLVLCPDMKEVVPPTAYTPYLMAKCMSMALGK